MKRLWYAPVVDKNSPDTIHQILAFGTLSDIKLLKKAVGIKRMRDFFIHYPKKVYTLPSLNFVKNFILKLHKSIDDQKYLKNTPRNIR